MAITTILLHLREWRFDGGGEVSADNQCLQMADGRNSCLIIRWTNHMSPPTHAIRSVVIVVNPVSFKMFHRGEAVSAC